MTNHNTGNQNTGNHNTGNRNTGNHNTGKHNTGDINTGNQNTGDQNTGSWNTSDHNTGDSNTGDSNTGDWNTGDSNTGDWNTGDSNTGNWNTGNWNTGSWNTGSWNAGDQNTGYCNSITPDDCLIFNKPGRRSDWDAAKKPRWMLASLTQWIDENDMTDKEKSAYPTYVTLGGYLKCFPDLRAAFIDAWEKATPEDRALTEKLPNFDPDVFAEVFGFNPFKKPTKKVTLELTDEQLSQVREFLGRGSCV
jgi:hypothetical protein